MFENVLSKEAIKIVDTFSPMLGNFYLAGGTGLSLQLGHRKSEDMDFFSMELFNTEVLLSKIKPEHTLYVTEGTVHCELKGIKLSFLFYKQHLRSCLQRKVNSIMITTSAYFSTDAINLEK